MSKPKRYRKLPVEVEALQVGEASGSELRAFCGAENIGLLPRFLEGNPEEVIIFTLEGKMKASKGDYIIKGVEGELYPIKKTIFDMTYEEVVY